VIRILCIGDVHLREGEHLDDVEAALAFSCQLANERDVHGVLLAGDLFEGKSSPAERRVLGDALFELATDARHATRPVVVVKGNHDQPGDLAVYDPYPGVTVCEQPRVVRLQHPRSLVPVDVLAVPWPERAYLAAAGHTGEAGERAGSAALTAMLRGMVATRLEPHRPLIVLGHLQVLGAQSSSAQPLIGKAIEAVAGDLADLGAAAVVLGHVHKPQQIQPGIEYVGSLTCHDFGEQDENKRVVLLTVHEDGSAEWESIPVPCRRWVTVEAEAWEAGVVERSDGRDLAFSGGTLGFSGANVRYRYRCDEADAALFDHVEIERRFAAAHTLKIVPEITRAQRVRAAEVAAARTPEAKLREWGRVTETEIPDTLIDKLHELQEVEHG